MFSSWGVKIKNGKAYITWPRNIHATNLDNRSWRLPVFVRKTFRETHRQNNERLTSSSSIYLRFSSAIHKCSHRSLIQTEDYRIGLLASFMLRKPQWQSFEKMWFSMNKSASFQRIIISRRRMLCFIWFACQLCYMLFSSQISWKFCLFLLTTKLYVVTLRHRVFNKLMFWK